MKKSLVLVVTLYFLTISLQAVVPSTCIDALNKKIAQMSPIKEDITYLIADIKYDGKQVKICEFGEGTRSRYKGYDYMYGKGIVWDRLWDVLAEYKFPKWYIDPDAVRKSSSMIIDKEVALKKFQSINGHATASVNDLVLSEAFDRAFRRKHVPLVTKNVKTDGLVMIRHQDASLGAVAKLRQQYKNLMVLNTAAAPFVNDKYTTDVLFKDEELQRFRPQAMLCRFAYTAGLAKEIKEKLPSTHYVIKPLDGWKGCGVVMVEEAMLDGVLKCITSRSSRTRATDQTYHFNGYSYTDRTYSYWAEYREPYFIIEEMCLSRVMEYEGKRYDPTMRVIFVMRHFNDEIKIDYLGAYWKMPLKSLDEKGTLTEKHKSVGIIPIDSTEQDRKEVYGQLDVLLPALYRKMINIINNKTPLAVPLSV